MTRHKHADAIIAWANGEEIEFRNMDMESWLPMNRANPMWHEYAEYRIKPKTVKREGWVALFGADHRGLPSCCGIYATKESCQEVNGPAAKVVRIEWEEEV